MVASIVTSLALGLHLPMFSIMSSTEPPGMNIPKECSQLELYTPALEQWVTITRNPELYRKKSSNLDNPKGVNNGDIQKFVSWLEEKFRMSKHSNIVEVPSRFINTTRAKSRDCVAKAPVNPSSPKTSQDD